jgi:hypothetical protein
VVFPPCYVADGVFFQGSDGGGEGDDFVGILSAGGDAGFSEVVGAPCVHRSVFGDGEGVVRAACYLAYRR